MSKSDTNLENIDIGRAKTSLRKPEWVGDKEIVAFDTETTEGNIFIISTSSNEKEFVYENNSKVLSPERIFDIITQKYFRSTLNIWFNLGFDAEVILKVLPEEKLTKLQVLNQVEWKKYRITYLPNKFLRIETGISPKDEKGRNFQNKYEYYDVAQLFGNNLEKSVDEWLPNVDMSKNEEDIDVTKFDNSDYIKDNYKKICKYAKQDAKLTRLITEKLINTAEDIDIPCGKPFSTGYLAESYLRNRLDKKIGWGPDKMQEMAWDTFAGGRFEVFKRGDVGEVVGPDINSAYPAIMTNLPDPKTLDWKYFNSTFKTPEIETIKQSDYGFLSCNITTDKTKKIQPFAVKMNDIVKYPALDNHNITVIKDNFIWALENGYIEDYEIDMAFLAKKTSNTRYPFQFFPDLYDKRKTWENKENKIRRAWLLKIILNSMYGKTAQTQYKTELLEEDLDITDIPDMANAKPGPRGKLPHLQYQECGSLFNPFIATYITGLTRLELHKQVENYDLVEDTILFATDSIMVNAKAYHDSNFHELISNGDTDYAKQLGKWDFDYQGKGFVIGSGVYEVELKDSDYIKMATRGFNEAKLKSFKNAAKESISNQEDSITIKHNRPITLGEAIHQKKVNDIDIGKFTKGQRELKPDFDQKRNWQTESITWNELLDGIDTSKPLVKKAN